MTVGIHPKLLVFGEMREKARRKDGNKKKGKGVVLEIEKKKEAESGFVLDTLRVASREVYVHLKKGVRRQLWFSIFKHSEERRKFSGGMSSTFRSPFSSRTGAQHPNVFNRSPCVSRHSLPV